MLCIAVVDSPDVDLCLDHSDCDYESRHKLLHPYKAEKLVATPLSTCVNNDRNQGPKRIEPITNRWELLKPDNEPQ